MELAEKIQQLRNRAGLSQSALAEKAGVPVRSVQNWEQGHRSPRVEHVPALARALGVTVDELLSDAAGAAPVEEPAPAKRTKRKGGGKA